jgi:uncharacterized protein YegL
MAIPAPDPAFGEDWGEQLLNGGVEFADNPEPRCPCVLLLDVSKSMRGEPIRALNDGLLAFRDDLVQDALARRRVEVSVVTFGGDVRVVQNFVTVDDFAAPVLQADGLTTPMGSGIHKALDLLDARKGQYRAHGVSYYRPWVFLITDGTPTGETADTLRKAARRVHAGETEKHLAFFGVGVGRANMGFLAKIGVRLPIYLKGLRFVDLFVWLSRSTQQVAHSQVGDQVPLPPLGDWGTV